MKKKNILINLLILSILLLTSCGGGKAAKIDVPKEIPGEAIYIPFPYEITVDGNLEDWQKLPSYTVTNGSMPSSDPAENGSFTFSVAADADFFYITMQMPDQNIIAGQHGAEFWNEDSMEFYINASGDLNATSYKTGMFQANFNAADIGNTDPDALTITGVFSTDIPISGYVFKTETGWGVEAALALDGILNPMHGLEIGFQAQINGATKQDRDVKLIWSKADTKDTSWQYPNLFGRAIFFKIGRKDIPQPSVVQALPTATPTAAPVVIPEMVSVNQAGYLPEGPKVALLALDATTEQDWELHNGSDDVVLRGKTMVKGLDETSGDFLHVIDFSEYSTEGNMYQIKVNDLQSPIFSISADVYSQLMVDSTAYFYHNRSGIAIEAQYVGDEWARPAGHLTDSNVTCYKGQDADGNDWPGCDYTLDVAGGWYDAGDFGKYVVNGGISVWTLMNLYELMPDAYADDSLSIPERSNGVPDILDEARWEMEFLLSMQVPDGEPQAGMAHHKIHDESWAGMPMVPPTEVENDNANEVEGRGRYLFPPSTAATLNLAAAGAMCARIWEDIDPAFAEQCLSVAETAWQAAVANPTMYAGNTPGQGGGNYVDKNVSDEFYWAAAELFITTGKDVYKTYMLNSQQFGTTAAFEWGRTASLGTISLLSTSNSLPEEKLSLLQDNVLAFANEMIAIQKTDGYYVPIKGAYPWGSNGQILNNMMLIGMAYRIKQDTQYLDAMQLGMDYILGRNPLNQSYVSGYGTYAVQHPHHRFWANDFGNGYPPPPPGVLSGGPNANPNDPVAANANLASLPESKRYIDDIGSFTTNEVTINWNAPLVWVSAFLQGNHQ